MQYQTLFLRANGWKFNCEKSELILTNSFIRNDKWVINKCLKLAVIINESGVSRCSCPIHTYLVLCDVV